ncbi:MAG: histidine kinase [Candidatus Krumholzibacteriia bacterium]
MRDSIQQRLQERVKELTALHRAARLLQDTSRDLDELMPAVVALLPPAWQYPEHTQARLTWRGRHWSTPGFLESPWRQREDFQTRDGGEGTLWVIYTSERPELDEGPFLAEERELIRSVADMLRAHFQHREDDAAILAANERLERQVAERTARLRRLSREISLAEERERRRIAEDLHDHLGQALAVIKLRLKQLHGDAVLGGHDRALAELVQLCDQAIGYSRGLTFELSPPVLYELGLGPALEWYGERIAAKHGLRVGVQDRGRTALPDDLKVMLWKCARELVHNVVKHADARNVTIVLEQQDDRVTLVVADDGRGFDPDALQPGQDDHFGLLSIEERLRDDGGGLVVEAAPGRGARVTLHARVAGGAP